MGIEEVNKQVELLRQQNLKVDVVEVEKEQWFYIVFHNYALPRGYNKSITELLVKLPLAFPDGNPDMFWTDPDLLLKDGRVPKSADHIETPLGRDWRRFSYHPSSWNPGVDNLLTYVEFVNVGLQKARQV